MSQPDEHQAQDQAQGAGQASLATGPDSQGRACSSTACPNCSKMQALLVNLGALLGSKIDDFSRRAGPYCQAAARLQDAGLTMLGLGACRRLEVVEGLVSELQANGHSGPQGGAPGTSGGAGTGPRGSAFMPFRTTGRNQVAHQMTVHPGCASWVPG